MRVGADGIKVATILSSYNRRAKTEQSVRSIIEQASRIEGCRLNVVVADASSTDGTKEMLRLLEIEYAGHITVVDLGENSFWAQSMAAAEDIALAASPDFILWLNDDVVLNNDALQRLLDPANRDELEVIVGATSDSKFTETTYSGLRRTSPSRLTSLVRVEPSASMRIDTFNGNIVLIPAAISARVGRIDARLIHSYADLDYGFRVCAAGGRITLAAGWLGICDRNSGLGTWVDSRVGRWTRIRSLVGVKGRPPRALYRLLRRNTDSGRVRCVLQTASGYVRPVTLILLGKGTRA